MPAAQPPHSLLRVDDAKRPASQAVQAARPVVEAIVPAAHGVQTGAPAVAATVPRVQFSHADAATEPGRLVLPAAQTPQLSVDRLSCAEKRPAWHGTHAACPVSFWKRPAPHV